MDTEQHPTTIHFGGLRVASWIVLTLIGFMLGLFLHFPGNAGFTRFDTSAAAFGFILGAISGLITAALQWIVLKPWFRSPWMWLALNAVGWGFVHALNDGILLQTQLSFLLAAIMVALPQSIALRRHLTNAALWIPVAALAWFAGFQLGDTLYAGEDPGNLLVAGLVVGVITGLAIRFLLVPAIQLPDTQATSQVNIPRWKRVQQAILWTLVAVFWLYFALMAIGLSPFG